MGTEILFFMLIGAGLSGLLLLYWNNCDHDWVLIKEVEKVDDQVGIFIGVKPPKVTTLKKVYECSDCKKLTVKNIEL